MADQAAIIDGLTSLVEQRCGLRHSAIGERLRAFLSDQAVGDPAQTLACLADQGDGWVAMVEALLVHETYFFRHPDQLSVLAKEVLPLLLRQRASTSVPLSVWCAGCATGEEAFTLASLLYDARCPARILGTDLSPDAVAVAEAGYYRQVPGLGSFRDMPPHAWHHFDADDTRPGVWRVGSHLRKDVRFMVHNLMTPHHQGYTADLISCRNTLLYFSDTGLRRAEESLVAAARPGTVLLLGPADRLRYTSVFAPMTRSNTQILHWPRDR